MAKNDNRITIYLDELTKKKFIKKARKDKRTDSQMGAVIIYEAVKDIEL